MKGELFIDNKDAFVEYGATLMETSVSQLLAPAAMKPMVENTSRLENGKHIIVNNLRVESREITLTMGVKGATPADFQNKAKKLVAKFQSGELALRVPSASSDTFYLIFSKNTQYAQNKSGIFCKLACKFIEPDPTRRT